MSNRPFNVVLYGATGFTGKLIAQELTNLGMSFLLSGRSPEKLKHLSDSLEGNPPYEAVGVDEPERMVETFAKGTVLISAAGPFGKIGMPVARAALAAGAHYLDTTGDSQFMRTMATELDDAAKKAKVAMSPAMGFDVVPGDLGAWLGACSLSDDGSPAAIESVDIIYNVEHPAITRGTFKSMLEGKSRDEAFIWENYAWRPVGFFEETKTFQFPGQKGARVASLTELAESLTVSRALNAATVKTYMMFDEWQVPMMKVVGPLGKLLLTSPLGPGVKDLVEKLPEGPDLKARAKTKFQICSVVTAKNGKKVTVVVSGADPYGLTGEALAVYAQFMCQKGYNRKGVISPCQVADPEQALAAIKRYPLKVEFVS